MILLLVACEYPTKQPPAPRGPVELGGIRGLVTGGGWSPNAMGSPSRWLERGGLRDMTIAIDEEMSIKTDEEGRFELLLPHGLYGVRVIAPPASCKSESEVVEVLPGRYTDVLWRCSFIYL